MNNLDHSSIGAPANVGSENSIPAKLPRAEGRVEIAFRRNARGTSLDDLFQKGCLKARFPTPEPGQICEAVLINTAGGLTDCDRLEQRIRWRKNSIARVTTQAAERIYRSRLAPAVMDTRLHLEKNSFAHWLPQETILFNGGRLHRTNVVTMEKGARFIGTESLIFGRSAMGERVDEGGLLESWRIRYDSRLIFADGLKLRGDIDAQLRHKAVADGMRACATVLYVGEDAARYEAIVKKASEKLSDVDVRAACSLLPNIIIIRILAHTGVRMRRAQTGLLKELISADGNNVENCLPRIWSC